MPIQARCAARRKRIAENQPILTFVKARSLASLVKTEPVSWIPSEDRTASRGADMQPEVLGAYNTLPDVHCAPSEHQPGAGRARTGERGAAAEQDGVG